MSIDFSGGIDLALSSLGNTTISINLSGGGINCSLKYGEYTGESKLSIKIDDGALNMDIELPSNAKVRLDGSVSGGSCNIDVDGNRVSGNYMDQGYSSASTRLYISYNVSGGVASMGIKR
ncbi:MAG: hypothetical protein J7K21_05910 [Desulfurococcales archaeon]|nr:hypothetical protein [Desulfurococcales archaeon]